MGGDRLLRGVPLTSAFFRCRTFRSCETLCGVGEGLKVFMLIQKFFPGLRLGLQPKPQGSKHELFSRQGHWDGGSTLHCIAMALTLLGKLADPRYLPYHRTGNERVVWDAAWPHYLHGLTLCELASFIAELNLELQPSLHTGPASGVLAFCASEIAIGRPVVVGWHQRHPVQAHAALVIGIEGRQVNRAFVPQALLLLDPAGCEPGMAGFNARFECSGDQSVRYVSPSSTRRVALEGAISLRTHVSASAGA